MKNFLHGGYKQVKLRPMSSERIVENKNASRHHLCFQFIQNHRRRVIY